jgi:hypothetical protein
MNATIKITKNPHLLICVYMHAKRMISSKIHMNFEITHKDKGIYQQYNDTSLILSSNFILKKLEIIFGLSLILE